MTSSSRALSSLFGVALVACSMTPRNHATASPPRGGTLRVVLPRDISTISTEKPPYPALDPQMEYSYDSWELFRCCLLRTLMGHDGHDTQHGGASLHPDLAAAVPDVSADGLTWTFRLRRGVHYAPPLASVEVTAGDFVRALRREAKLGAPFYSYYFSAIRGFDAYAKGSTDTISGLEAPDPNTLIIRLTHPQGDLGYRMTLAATAPIPASPTAPDAPFGVATGHDADGYGKILVATGPYMLDGSASLDLSRRDASASGFAPGKHLTFVRNPSWSGGLDSLRAAYPDRIEVTTVDDDTTAIDAMIENGRADVNLDYRPPEAPLLELAQKMRNDSRRDRVHLGTRDFIRYVSMNLAVPPFDDVHVRRAFNLVVDKAAVQKILGGPLAGFVAHHMVFDSMENNFLVAYNPYPSANDAGDLVAAKKEMAQSRYDHNRDGVCDARECAALVGLSLGKISSFSRTGRAVAADGSRIGLHIRSIDSKSGPLFKQIGDPKTHTPLSLTTGWGKDFINASNFIDPLFSRSSIGTNNYSLLGASPAQLASWGYRVHSVPGIDDRIDACVRIAGDAELSCWSSLDQYLMEQVVPWVPLSFEAKVLLTSERVVSFSFDQYANEAALDRLALRPDSTPSP